MKTKQFNHTVVAGTFDRLHQGHHHLLTIAANQSRQLSCGLTTQAFVNQSHKTLKLKVQPYKQRYHQLKKLTAEISVIPLNDVCGPAATDPDFDSIAFTRETRANAELVNRRRRQNRLPPLAPIFVDLVPAQDKNRLSSTRIRLGQTNRTGLVYSRLLPEKTIFLPEEKRRRFKTPFGQLIPASNRSLDWAVVSVKKNIAELKPELIITVGDLTSQAFIRHQIPVTLVIFDYQIQRQPIPEKLPLNNRPLISVKNPPGCLHPSLITELKKLLAKPLELSPSLIRVYGEEDLAVIPLVLLSPLNTLIFYGQPNQGLVMLKVTETNKMKALQLLGCFTG